MGRTLLRFRVKSKDLTPFLSTDHAEVKIGTLLAIIRQSGVPRGDFEE